jgi:hypothetical protein
VARAAVARASLLSSSSPTVFWSSLIVGWIFDIEISVRKKCCVCLRIFEEFVRGVVDVGGHDCLTSGYRAVHLPTYSLSTCVILQIQYLFDIRSFISFLHIRYQPNKSETQWTEQLQEHYKETLYKPFINIIFSNSTTFEKSL